MSKILILGASGYVGQATVNALQDPKYSKFEISAGVRNPADAKNASLKTGKVQLVACDSEYLAPVGWNAWRRAREGEEGRGRRRERWASGTS